MKRTFCGKDCDACGYREQIQCPGCLSEPTDGLDMDCAVARCCRFRQLESCADCEKIVGCDTLTRCDRTAEQKVKKWEAEEAKRVVVREKAPYLGKWLRILFWVSLVNIVLGWLGEGTLVSVANIALSILTILVFWKLSDGKGHYRTALWCSLVSFVIRGANTLLTAGATGAMPEILPAPSVVGLAAVKVPVLLLSAAVAILALVIKYHTFKGHEEILRYADEELSEKWERLWKWYAGALWATLAGTVLAWVPLVGGLIVMIAAVIMLVVSVLELVYLHKTASCFETLGKDEAKPIE